MAAIRSNYRRCCGQVTSVKRHAIRAASYIQCHSGSRINVREQYFVVPNSSRHGDRRIKSGLNGAELVISTAQVNRRGK